MKEDISEEIKLIFLLDNQETDIINCHIKEKLKNMFDVYCRIKNIEKNSVYILYGGNIINNFELTLEAIANKLSKANKEITFLVCHKPNSVFIIFSHQTDLYKEKKNLEDYLDTAFSGYLLKNKIDRNNVVLRYNNQIIEPNLTINQFITKHNINLGNMDLQNDDNLIEIKIDVIDIQEAYKIISFSHQKKKDKYRYALEKNMGDIFNDYITKNKINKNKVEFKYKGIPIKKNQSLDEFIQNNINNKKIQNEIYDIMNSNEMKEKESIITIDVIDLSYPSYFFRTYKLPISIIIGIIIVVGVTVLIVLLFQKLSNSGTSTIENNIIPDNYFINATYFSDKSETVKLISDEYDLNKIKIMSIEDKIINSIKSYTFREDGKHIVYYSFNQISDKSLLSEGRYIFNGISKLIYIKFSNFGEYYADVSFQGMFNNCINLLSADFSQMNPNDDFYYNYYGTNIYNYYYSTDYMFNNCRKLTSINFDFKKDESSNTIDIMSSKYMFNNCTSLTELYLSKINFYNNLNNMFSNCTSLEAVILSNFYYFGDNLNMSYMFYNCTSLVSLIFPSENMNIPHDMSYSFAYCSSLNYDYYDNIRTNTMKGAFRNCTSLVSINLKFEFYYEDMSYLFMVCSSLENININNNNYFYFPFTKYMNGMFIDCNSFLVSPFIEKGFYSQELRDISYMFSGSYIAFVDFSNVETNHITNYEGLFYGCEHLSSVDLSSFTHNNLPLSNLSIFKGNYPSFPRLVINEEFLNRIEVPSSFVIILYKNNNTYDNFTDF